MNGFLFGIVSVLWGFSFLAIRFSLEGLPPFAAATSRVLLSVLLFVGLARISRTPFPPWDSRCVKLLGVGLINFGIPWALLFWSELYIAPSVASILNSTAPFFVFLFSWFLLQEEELGWLRFVGVLLGFGGILFVFGPGVQKFSVDRMQLYGMGAAMLMAICYALGTVLTKRLGTFMDVRWNVSLQGIGALLFLLPLTLMCEGTQWVSSIPSANIKVIGSMLYLCIFSTVLAWIIFFRLLHQWGPVRASSTTYIVPMVAILVDWLYDHRIPASSQLMGAALILSAVGLLQVSRVRRLMKRKRTIVVRSDDGGVGV